MKLNKSNLLESKFTRSKIFDKNLNQKFKQEMMNLKKKKLNSTGTTWE
jgi:hypothetical protein